MAGPGKKGHLFKRQYQEQQLTKNSDLGGSSQKDSSKSPNSDPSSFHTPNSSPLGRRSEETIMQPQTSESRASGQHEGTPTSENQSVDGMKFLLNFLSLIGI